MNRDALEPYLARLRALPFVAEVALEGDDDTSCVLRLDTPGASQRFTLRLQRSNLTKADVELWAGRARALSAGEPLMLFAPNVSAPMSARLREAAIRYVDAVGNVSLAIDGPAGPQHVALVEGRVPVRVSVGERAWRAQSYQVLFALLAQPSLLNASVRDLARAAEVSTSPVLQVRQKLLNLELVVNTGRTFQWMPRGTQRAREFWLRGYQSTLRPQLLLQRFVPRSDLGVNALEAEIALRLDGRFSWRWGGAAASFRLDHYYRGETSVVHIDAPATVRHELAAALRMIPDPAGPVIVLQRPGPLAFELPASARAGVLERRTLAPDVVHPLLAWAELLEEGHDRASEAAAELATRFFTESEHAES